MSLLSLRERHKYLEFSASTSLVYGNVINLRAPCNGIWQIIIQVIFKENVGKVVHVQYIFTDRRRLE